MKNITSIEPKLPHIVQEVICINCKNRWIDIRPESVHLKDCQCSHCGETGYIIATGDNPMGIDSCEPI